jgi:hypothetical protein
MLKYIESEKYKRDPHIAIHFILLAICIVAISIGVMIFFF